MKSKNRTFDAWMGGESGKVLRQMMGKHVKQADLKKELGIDFCRCRTPDTRMSRGEQLKKVIDGLTFPLCRKCEMPVDDIPPEYLLFR